MGNILASLYLDVCGAVLVSSGVSWEDDRTCSHIILASVNSQHFTLPAVLVGPSTTSLCLKVSQVSDITPTPILGDLSQPGTHHGEGSSLQDYR